MFKQAEKNLVITIIAMDFSYAIWLKNRLILVLKFFSSSGKNDHFSP